MISCEFYLELKDYAPKIIVAVLFCALTVYSCFFLRPPFMRKVREWTDKEFFLYSLLVILLLGIAFIIFKVLESGSKLFCSIWIFVSLTSATVRAENKAQNIDIAVHKKSVSLGSLYQQKISAKRLTASQHINLSAEVIFTFSSGYWVWIFVWQLKFYPVHRRPISWGWDDGGTEIFLHPSSVRPLLSGNCASFPVSKGRKKLCVLYRTRPDACRHSFCPYRLLRFCGTGQLRGLIWTVFK